MARKNGNNGFNRREIHEMNAVYKAHVVNDEGLKGLWKRLNGHYPSKSEWRSFCFDWAFPHYWRDYDPYLDKAYVDYMWVRVGSRIVNTDDLLVMMENALIEDIRVEKAKALTRINQLDGKDDVVDWHDVKFDV